MRSWRLLVLVTLLLLLPLPLATAANLSLGRIFTDHMVLQRDQPIPIWGRTVAGARVEVTLAGNRVVGTANDEGQWSLLLPALAAGGPHTLSVEAAGETSLLEDVLVGEVWLCAGQSNMRWKLSQSASAAVAIAAADNPELRFFDMVGAGHPGGRAWDDATLARCNPEDFYLASRWQPSSPDTAASFSAVAYFFGATLQRQLGVPVGLIHNAIGGTCIEAYISRQGLLASDELRSLGEDPDGWLEHSLVPAWCRGRARKNLERWFADPQGERPGHPFQPSFLYEAGIRPLAPSRLGGVLWYQGESNATRPDNQTPVDSRLCKAGIQALITDWRRAFSDPELPFLQVQLPGMGRSWMGFREVQEQCLEIPGTGMAVTIDLGHPRDVHPRNKRDVGDRLARLALDQVYGHELEGHSPRVREVQRRGGELVVTCESVDGGLVTPGGEAPRGFEVAGRHGEWQPASAELRGERILLSSPRVGRPQAARHAWAPFPDCNVTGGGGLPLGPFRGGDLEFRTRPNVLLIVSEDHGPELGCYGDSHARTPHLDELAREGVRFANAFVPHSVCSPSRASLLTGLYPHQNGQIGLATHRYAMFRRYANLSTILADAGYRTGILGKLHVNPASAFDFDLQWNPRKATSFAHRDVARVAEVAGEHFSASAEPFFLMVNFPDAHLPLLRQQHGLPAEPFVAGEVPVLPFIGVDDEHLRQGVADYYSCISRMDSGVGLLMSELEASGKSEDTLVIYLSDHGAQFSRGKATCYEAGLRVPMILRWPGEARPGLVPTELVSSLDVLPTVCDLLDIPAPEALPGRTLRPQLRGKAGGGHQYIFGQRTADAQVFYFPQRTVRDERYKLIRTYLSDRPNPEFICYETRHNAHFAFGTTSQQLAEAPAKVQRGYETWRQPPAVQLYDLRDDPHEWNDLAGDPQHAATRARLSAVLEEWQVSTDDRIRHPEVLARLTREHDEAPRDYRTRPDFRWEHQDYLGSRQRSRPNVLFLAVDDLRPELGCYGDSQALTPNIDRLAARGTLFERAYTPMAVCCPSRTAVMTGLRPDTTRVWRNTHFRKHRPDAVTLPELFKEHGYASVGFGKIYHDAFDPDIHPYSIGHDDQSWSEPFWCPGPRYYYTPEGIEVARRHYVRRSGVSDPGPDEWTTRWCPGLVMEAPEVDDSVLYDGQVADRTIAALRRHSGNTRPFFLAAGFLRPHLPFVAPKKYWDLYDPARIELATNGAPPAGVPPIALHDFGELRYYEGMPRSGPIPDDLARQLRHGYLACVSFVDAQVGRILDELDALGLADETVVVLWGDHGWHLGEHGLWAKTTNFENDTRSPLIISAPGQSAAGGRARATVELIDVYPTLADLAGLPVAQELEGRSLRRLLDDPAASHQHAAYSQFPRGGNVHAGGKVMGYSSRTDRWRYTEWVRRKDGVITARELYDHRTDPQENRNLAADPEHALTIEGLAKQMRGDLGYVAMPAPAPAPPAELSTGFEELAAGEFERLETEAGIWTAEKGHAEIDPAHRRGGRQCLHILGGQERRVVFTPALGEKEVSELSFWAERWTRRAPFTFRVEALAGGNWSEVYRGDDEIVIGGFETHVRVPLPVGITRLRLTCTSPDRSGILIDDLELGRAEPMKVAGVTTVQPVAPCLVRNQENQVAVLRIETTGTLEPIEVEEIHINTRGTTDLADVATVEILGAGGTRFGAAAAAAETLVFRGKLRLERGVNELRISFRLRDRVDLDHLVDAGCSRILLAGGVEVVPEVQDPEGRQRIGVAVRRGGDDGAAVYRIPGIATTPRGTLIAVYDIRWQGWGDLPGNVDVGMSRSTDAGLSWEPMRVIMDMGDDPKFRHDGVGDPAVLVDANTQTIWVAAVWSHGNRAWRGSQPGLSADETGQLMLARSDDDGRSWSAPINITRQVKDPAWCYLLQGPGAGITMADGTLVFAAQFQDTPERKRMPYSTILYSRDHGETWKLGTGAKANTTEAQVVEIEPGVLMLNMRDNRGGSRSIYTTADLGATWQEHPTSRRALIEPVCNAGLVHAGGEALVFCNPNVDRAPRRRMTLKCSPDSGKTWPADRFLLLDEGQSAGYSSLTMVDDDTVGVLFEGSQAHMTYMRVPLAELLR